jgi:hypothetical protein
MSMLGVVNLSPESSKFTLFCPNDIRSDKVPKPLKKMQIYSQVLKN